MNLLPNCPVERPARLREGRNGVLDDFNSRDDHSATTLQHQRSTSTRNANADSEARLPRAARRASHRRHVRDSGIAHSRVVPVTLSAPALQQGQPRKKPVCQERQEPVHWRISAAAHKLRQPQVPKPVCQERQKSVHWHISAAAHELRKPHAQEHRWQHWRTSGGCGGGLPPHACCCPRAQGGASPAAVRPDGVASSPDRARAGQRMEASEAAVGRNDGHA